MEETVETRVAMLEHDLQDVVSTLKEIAASLKEIAGQTQRTDEELQGWVKTLRYGTAVFVSIGTFTLVLFGWVLLQKNTEIQELRAVAVTNQKAIEKLMARQDNVLAELREQHEIDTILQKQVYDILVIMSKDRK
jgi:predicted AlkP superfamily phosphohydrolase/phosphomutase